MKEGFEMDLQFYPVWTQDGSVGLFNIDLQDVYHSRFGAQTEADEKFFQPCGIEEKLNKNSAIKILDICYGMGYNSKSAI